MITALLLAPFPLAAAWLAARLLRDLSPAERAVVLAGTALAAGSGLLSPSLPQNDAWAHYLHLREALGDPTRLLDPWDRPGFTLLYAAPAALGIHAARLLSAVLAAIAGAATIRAARALDLPHPWLAGLFLLAQHDVFGQAGSTMTELPFAAAFAVAVAALLERRPWVAAVALGWCAITRPEGPLYAGVGAAWLLLRGGKRGPAALALAAFPLYVLAGALAFRDPLWMVNQNPYRGLVGHRFELAQLWRSWFFASLWLGQPRVLLVLEVAGAAASLAGLRADGRARHGRLAFLLAPLAVSYLLLTFLRIGESDAWRESRYLVTVAPALALLALAGLDAIAGALPRLAPAAVLALAAWAATWTLAWHWRPPGQDQPLDVTLASAILAAVAALLGAAPRVPARAALAVLLAAPLAGVPPGTWANHRAGQTPARAAGPAETPPPLTLPAADR